LDADKEEFEEDSVEVAQNRPKEIVVPRSRFSQFKAYKKIFISQGDSIFSCSGSIVRLNKKWTMYDGLSPLGGKPPTRVQIPAGAPFYRKNYAFRSRKITINTGIAVMNC